MKNRVCVQIHYFYKLKQKKKSIFHFSINIAKLGKHLLLQIFHQLKTPWKRRFSFSFSIEFDSRVPKFMVNEEDNPHGSSDIDFMCDEDNYC